MLPRGIFRAFRLLGLALCLFGASYVMLGQTCALGLAGTAPASVLLDAADDSDDAAPVPDKGHLGSLEDVILDGFAGPGPSHPSRVVFHGAPPVAVPDGPVLAIDHPPQLS
jgi:hypothetical protein